MSEERVTKEDFGPRTTPRQYCSDRGIETAGRLIGLGLLAIAQSIAKLAEVCEDRM
jgi:hypothetical protein